MNYEVTVDTTRVEQMLRTRFGPPEVSRRLRAALQDMVAMLQGEVVKRTPVGATGLLRGGITTDVRGTGFHDMRGTVSATGAAAKYAAVVEHGRSPGAFPPRAPLELWAQRVLGDASLWYVVARKIARSGTKGQFMFRDALRKNRSKLPGILARHFQR